MSYSVIFAIDFGTAPERVRPEIERVFLQIAEAVDTIPESSPFFASMDDSVLQIDVEGFRIGYRVVPRRRELRVIELAPIPPRL